MTLEHGELGRPLVVRVLHDGRPQPEDQGQAAQEQHERGADHGATSRGVRSRTAARRRAERARRFLSDAPTSAAEAATIILDGVKAERWRILVGSDAHLMDRMVRDEPEHAYEEEFFSRFVAAAGWHPGR